MPYVNKPRPYKKEYQQQKARDEHEGRMERQRARRAVDKKGKDENGNGKADARKQTASGSRGVEFRLSPDLPITEAELQIVETYLSAMIRDLLDEAEASEELFEG